MHYSLKSFKRMQALLFAAMLMPLSVTGIMAGEPQYALMDMPKADRSLLLDIHDVDGKLVVVGDRGHILVSDDYFASWQQKKVPTAKMLTAVHFANEKGWAVGHDGHIVFSEDGGQSWVRQRDGLKAQAVRNEQLLRRARAELRRLENLKSTKRSGQDISEKLQDSIFGFDDEPMSLDEQLEEARWQVESAQLRLQETAVPPPLLDVWFADEKRGWAVGAFGTLLSTTDGGQNWIYRDNDIVNRANYHLNAVTGTEDGLVIVAGESGYLIYSEDAGKTWNDVELDTNATLFGLVTNGLADTFIAVGLRGAVFKTADRGKNWHELASGIDYSLANGAMQGDYLVLVGAGGSIAVSEDAGETFERFILPSRSSLSQVIIIEKGRFLLVGQGGVHHFDVSAASEQ